MKKDYIQLGDSYELIKTLPDKSVDLIVTDPPYQINNTNAGNSKIAYKLSKYNKDLEYNNITNSIDVSILGEFLRVLKKPNIYIWCNHIQIPLYLDFFVNQRHFKFDILIWHKSNALPTYFNKYLTDKEYCLYFRNGGYCNPETYQDAKTVFISNLNHIDKSKYGHPTIKPLNIIETLIRNSSKEGDIVFDPFIGSGTTAIACKKQNRHYIGFEINEQYYNLAQERIANTNVAESPKLSHNSLF